VALFARFSGWFSGRESHSRIPSVEQTWEAAIVRLRKRIENPSRLMRRLGVLMVGESQKAFQEQALGEIKWPVRYPNQADPYVNIAGALMDLDKGPSIKSRRFDRRPALIDTGMLLRSMTSGQAISMEGRKTVVVGTTRKNALQHQIGGTTEMPITENMRKNLAILEARAKQQMESVFMAPRAKGMKKLMPPHMLTALAKIRKAIAHKSVLVTELNRRPFLGITDTLADTMIRTIQDEFAPGRTTT
jgi:phage gpG-like protein